MNPNDPFDDEDKRTPAEWAALVVITIISVLFAIYVYNQAQPHP